MNEVQSVGSPFTRHLADGYRAFVNREFTEMYDHPDAIHFARKGLSAAAGETVLPEPVSDWNLLPEHIAMLSTARGRLLAVYDIGAREVAPQQAAIAQVNFDCWIEQQEENWQSGEITVCKDAFMTALSNLENSVVAPPPPPAPEQDFFPPVEPLAMDAPAPMRPEDAMYLVFFDFDSSKVAQGGMSVIDAIAQEAHGRSLNWINIVGHTDSAGPRKYNNRLALRRANAVRDSLVNRGISPALIQVESRGEDELLVATPDGVREPANRRAQITFE